MKFKIHIKIFKRKFYSIYTFLTIPINSLQILDTFYKANDTFCMYFFFLPLWML